MPKVSVIIPTHNRAEYLRGAICSVLSQTFQDFEVLVVDDASKDNTSDIARGFDSQRIKYLRHPANKGASAARNTGITNSKGEYIAFLDDDDEWLPEKLKLQVDLLEQSPAQVGAVYTAYNIVDRRDGKILSQKTADRRGNLAHALLAGNCVGSTSTMLLRRDCFERVGLFDESLPSFQDYDMWIRIAREFLFDCVEEPLVKYYVHGNKIWTNLEALSRGMDRMLEKYGQFPILRRNFAYYYLSLGVQYCEAGDAKKSRRAFLKAISLYPFEIRHYFNFLLSLLGPDHFRKAKETKEKFLGPLREKMPWLLQGKG